MTFTTSTPLRARPPRILRRFRLMPSGDGWSLIGSDGQLVFSALGLSGRRRCLEFARTAADAVVVE